MKLPIGTNEEPLLCRKKAGHIFFWGVIGPCGYLYEWTIYTRAAAAKEAMATFHGWPWQSCQKNGYRCVQFKAEIVKATGAKLCAY